MYLHPGIGASTIPSHAGVVRLVRAATEMFSVSNHDEMVEKYVRQGFWTNFLPEILTTVPPLDRVPPNEDDFRILSLVSHNGSRSPR